MTSNFMGFGFLLFSLPVLIALWVGVLSLGKTNRNLSWWFMMIGGCLTSLSLIGHTAYFAFPANSHSASHIASILVKSLTLFNGFSQIGTLLFYMGYAIHGLQSANARQRITELEAIAAAQGDELNRHRAS